MLHDDKKMLVTLFIGMNSGGRIIYKVIQNLPETFWDLSSTRSWANILEDFSQMIMKINDGVVHFKLKSLLSRFNANLLIYVDQIRSSMQVNVFRCTSHAKV